MTRISNAVLAISYPALSIASAHSATLRKGTQDDPDALDPALSGTCVGSIIFTSLCDKLVDISHDLKIVVKMFIPSQFPDQRRRANSHRSSTPRHAVQPSASSRSAR